jgi:hypothetical protein
MLLFFPNVRFRLWRDRVRYLVPSPATDRLDWLLDGLNGDAGWGGDAADTLAPPFAALIPPDQFAARMRRRAAALAPAGHGQEQAGRRDRARAARPGVLGGLADGGADAVRRVSLGACDGKRRGAADHARRPAAAARPVGDPGFPGRRPGDQDPVADARGRGGGVVPRGAVRLLGPAVAPGAAGGTAARHPRLARRRSLAQRPAAPRRVPAVDGRGSRADRRRRAAGHREPGGRPGVPAGVTRAPRYWWAPRYW